MTSAATLPSLTIRRATADDAAACIEHARQVIDEFPDNLSFAPGEFDYTLEQEQKFLGDAANTDNALFLLALIDGQIVGLLNYTGGKRQCNRHAVVLGVSVRKEWCDRGIGTALVRAAIDHARASGVVKRIDLAVFTHNERAIHVYRKLGFIEEGHRRACALKNGQYIDDLIMAMLL
ncbi:MAG TPA: GNAT family N-acetyltransferase [Tepidisphaeraceae bacterium]|jgi:RimJ/RimL family protein N-acetyltransferase